MKTQSLFTMRATPPPIARARKRKASSVKSSSDEEVAPPRTRPGKVKRKRRATTRSRTRRGKKGQVESEPDKATASTPVMLSEKQRMNISHDRTMIGYLKAWEESGHLPTDQLIHSSRYYNGLKLLWTRDIEKATGYVYVLYDMCVCVCYVID